MEIIMNTEQNHPQQPKSSTITNIIHNNQYHPQQPILKQSFRVPQLLYVKIKDRINMTPLTNS
jgi:hypothetical protein